MAIDRYVSSAVELTCGVPHSSGLGPKLLKSHLFHKHKLCLVMSLRCTAPFKRHSMNTVYLLLHDNDVLTTVQ